MLPKSREAFGRTRTTPRAARRAPGGDSQAARMEAARQVATRFVAARWPELAGVEPVITALRPQQPSAELLARIGLIAELGAPRPSAGVEYSFTFARDDQAATQMCAPLVAVVTVDEYQRIVKTSVSK